MNLNNQVIDETSKCRICLKTAEPLYHLLSEVDHGGQTFAFKDLMQCVANLEISLTDLVPKVICDDCMEELVNAYSFVDAIREAEEYWRNTRPILKNALEHQVVKLANVQSNEQKATEKQLANENVEMNMATDEATEPTVHTQNEISNSASVENLQIDAVTDDNNFDVNALIEVDYSMLNYEDVLDTTTMLTEDAQSREKQEFKERSNTKCYRYCDYCVKRTKTEKYEIHLMLYHFDVYKKNIADAKTENRLYKCQHCNMEFAILICFQDHLKVDHKLEENEIILICPRCKRTFKKEHHFQMHFKYCDQVPTADTAPSIVATEEASVEMPLIQTEINFVDIKQNLNNAHDPIAFEENSTDDLLSWQATTNDTDSDSDYWAPYWSENERQTETPKNKICEDIDEELKYPCTQCSKLFLRKWNLQKHLKVVHEIIVSQQTGNFACSHCPRIFPLQSRLEAHQRLAHKHIYPCSIDFNKIYRRQLCHYCGLMVKSIKQHIWRHEDYKPFKCQYCVYAFVSKGALVEHERIHTGEKPFKCEACDKCFRKSSLKIVHMRVHTREKLYKCKICNKDFALVNNLKSHINAQHSGERPHICNVCNRSFSNSALLNVHRKKHKHWDTSGKDKYVKVRVGNSRRRWKS